MRFKMLALVGALGCFSASAYGAVPFEGYATTIGGRAHVEQQGDGTFVYLNGPSSVAGVVPFEDKSTFPDLYQLEGRDVQITGVLDGQGLITLTDPDQIAVIK